jgi:phosphoserine phosphatase RsbX
MEDLNHQLVTYGVATAALDEESGDQHLVQPYADGVLLAAVDGLGHGGKAAEAARLAVQLLQQHASECVLSLTRRCHQALQNSRGAVMSLASFHARNWTMTWIGIGNVSGRLFRADGGSSPGASGLLLRAGVVGSVLPELQAAVLPVGRGDTLIFATDGIAEISEHDVRVSDPPQTIADHILDRHYKGTDDATALVVRFLGEGT